MADPRDGGVFYVGHTSRLELRRAQHLEGGVTLVGLRVREIAAAGLSPLFVTLECCGGKQEALLAEIFWIELLRCRGVALANAQAFSGYESRAEEKRRARARLGEAPDSLERLANGRPAREGRRWSQKEDAMVRRLRREGKNIFQIADKVERSVSAITRRLARLQSDPR